MSNAQPSPAASNFLRAIVESDLRRPDWSDRRWAGQPALAAGHQTGAPDPARIRTRFPPEPNGYLHIGHAKSICLNFGLARDYGGVCHMRFDDTNPEKEDVEFVESILDVVRWLGFGWDAFDHSHLYHASNYFEWMYLAGEHLIRAGHAYIDEQTPEAIRAQRGTLTEPGSDSPWRNRPAAESLARFREMRAGQHPDGSMVLRARIDMRSPNINLRDPVIFRIRHAEHHRTGAAWCIYPMYTFAHPLEDAFEGITHSICTLEFEDQRPFYDWLLARLAEPAPAVGAEPAQPALLSAPLPRQYEFARLNLTYVITSKRKLAQLVRESHVHGWDDPRMPTLVGLRRRGYTPGAIRLFCDRIGVSKSDSWIEYSVLEQALRDEQDPIAPRAVGVLSPLKLVLTNWDADRTETCRAPVHPHDPSRGEREFPLTRELWIEREDFAMDPPKGFFRLFPGNKVRLKYGYVVECTGFVRNETGEITEVHAEVLPDTRSGTPGADTVKVKGVITWVSCDYAQAIEYRLYDRLFTEAHPDAGGRDFLSVLNPNSLTVQRGWLEPGTRPQAGTPLQLERLGYFALDPDSTETHPVLNRVTTLKDSWAK